MSDAPKRRTFRKFTFRGIDLDGIGNHRFQSKHFIPKGDQTDQGSARVGTVVSGLLIDGRTTEDPGLFGKRSLTRLTDHPCTDWMLLNRTGFIEESDTNPDSITLWWNSRNPGV